MYYYYKPQLKIKDGAATADYKSLIKRALATPVAEQKRQFDGAHHKNDVGDQVSEKYLS
jgi:hypothetical protein